MDRYDKDLVKQYANGKWADILARAFGVDPDVLDGKHHPCPRCGGTDRFRFTDLNGDGSALCNKCGKWGDGFAFGEFLSNEKFGPVLAKVAIDLGIEKLNGQLGASHGHGRKSKTSSSIDPAEYLTFQPWNEQLVALWCLSKPPITPAAVQLCGGRIARWSYYDRTFPVIALPVYGENLAAAPPVGWCIYNITGGTLPGPKKTQVKVKLTHGSNKPGFIGPVDQLSSAEEIWKLEGPSDLLSFYSLADRPALTHAVTNKAGAGETPVPWQLALFAGRRGRTLGDADKPGEAGAIAWAGAIATTAGESRRPILPYPIQETHGKDLRDLLNEPGRTFIDLAALAAAAPLAEPAELPSPATPSDQPLEDDDDPHRLARVNLARYATHREGATLRYWRGEWYKWAGQCYRRIEKLEFEAKLTASIKAEFDRQWREDMDWYEAKDNKPVDWEDKGPPKCRKVTTTLVNNVIRATASMTVLPDSIEPMTWIGSSDQGDSSSPTCRERRSYIAMENGLLDLERLLQSNPDDTLDDLLLPHSPNWFSQVYLPYAFNPDAACPKFDAFLERSLELDPERIKILQEWAGYLLLPDASHQKFLALEGEGANGKSVFCAAMAAMLGERNVSYVTLELLADKFERTETLGRLLNICSDAAELDKVSEGFLRAFTGGGGVSFGRKFLPSLQCKPTAKIMMAFNNRPRFSDRSGATWRRMLLIPWRIVIPEGERIPGMDDPDWWTRSGELPGIFKWAVVGLDRLRNQRRFTDCSLVTEALTDYQLDTNPARQFLTENCEESSGGKIRTQFLYWHYANWAVKHGHRPLSDRQFGKEVSRTFKNVSRKNGGGRSSRYYFYEGIIFSTEEIFGEKTGDASLF